MKKLLLIFPFFIISIKFSYGQIQCISCFNQNEPITSSVNNLILNGGFENGCPGFSFFCPKSLSYSCDITSWICSGGGDSTYANILEGGSTYYVEGKKGVYFGNSFAKACSAFANDNSCLNTSSCSILGIPKDYPRSKEYYGDSTGLSLQQTVNGLLVGTMYVLEFWAGGEWDYKNKGLFAVDVGFGNTMLSCNPTERSTDMGTRYIIKFIATSTSHTIKFTNWGHICSTCTELVIDDVKLYTASEFPDSLISKLVTQVIIKCFPETITVGNHTYSTSGIYSDTLKSNNDCTYTIIKTHLTILPLDTLVQRITLCEGETLHVGTHEYSTTGIFYDVLKKTNGCDSVVRSELNITPSSGIKIKATICSNKYYMLSNGKLVNTAGTYYDTLASALGCDSIVITQLSVNSYSINNISKTITCGQKYVLPSGMTVNSPGTYKDVLTNSKGCDSIINTFLTFEVSPLDLKTLIPNAFSPNNDGLNEELCIPANDCIKIINLIIYDRWGEKVFETNSFNDCWDGTYKGKKLDPSVFAYYFIVEFADGKTAKQKGNISLLK